MEGIPREEQVYFMWTYLDIVHVTMTSGCDCRLQLASGITFGYKMSGLAVFLRTAIAQQRRCIWW